MINKALQTSEKENKKMHDVYSKYQAKKKQAIKHTTDCLQLMEQQFDEQFDKLFNEIQEIKDNIKSDQYTIYHLKERNEIIEAKQL